jgi:hypothetical protein
MPNVDLGKVAAHRVEGGLQVRLVEAVHFRPAAAAELGKFELHQPLAGVVLEPIPLRCYEFGQQLVSYTECGEGPHRLIIEDAGPRQVIEARIPLQHNYAVSARPQHRGDDHADRPVSDNSHVGIQCADVLAGLTESHGETIRSTIRKVNAY